MDRFAYYPCYECGVGSIVFCFSFVLLSEQGTKECVKLNSRNLTLEDNEDATLENAIKTRSIPKNSFVPGARESEITVAKFMEINLCKSFEWNTYNIPRCLLGSSFFSEHKCQYCCSIASWYCWGKTHFCDSCHFRQQKGLSVDVTYLTLMSLRWLTENGNYRWLHHEVRQRETSQMPWKGGVSIEDRSPSKRRASRSWLRHL